MPMPPKILFITSNSGKLEIAKQVLQPFNIHIEGVSIDLPEPQSLDSMAIITLKVQEALKHKDQFPAGSGLLIDDTFLFLKALSGSDGTGLPGPLIKWFLESIGAQGIYDLAHKYNNFEASAGVVLGYVDTKNPEEILYIHNVVEGTIIPPQGSRFGFNPIFVPKGHTQSYGQMPDWEYRSSCPRAQALKDLIARIKG